MLNYFESVYENEIHLIGKVFDVLKAENLHGLEPNDLTYTVEWEGYDDIHLFGMVGDYMEDIGEGLEMVEEDKEALMNMKIDKEVVRDMWGGNLQGGNSIQEQASLDKDNYSEDMNCILGRKVVQHEVQQEDEVEEGKRKLDRVVAVEEEVVLMVVVVEEVH